MLTPPNAILAAMKPGGSPPTPPEIVQQVLDEYRVGKGATTIARLFGISKKTVYNILVRSGEGIRPMHDRTGTTRHMPPGILAGVTPSGRKRGGQPGVRLALNERAFDTLTDDAAYWIGFLMADGCISQECASKGRRLMVRLSVKDRGHLERFRTWLGSGHAIYEKDHVDPAGATQRTCCLQVGSDPLCAALARWGVVERKTGHEVPHADLLPNRHFWRGCVDGDGSVYASAARIYLSGGETIIRLWGEFCLRRVGKAADVRQHFGTVGGRGCWVGSLNGAAARRMCVLLYRPGDTFLPRKAVLAGIEGA